MPYAWREYPHRTHLIRWPANHGGFSSSEPDGTTRPALEVLLIGIAFKFRLATRVGAADSQKRYYCRNARRLLPIHLTPVRWWRGGFFRVIPYTSVGRKFREGSKATQFHLCLRSDSRKNRPRAERRPSFSPFFLERSKKKGKGIGDVMGWGRYFLTFGETFQLNRLFRGFS